MKYWLFRIATLLVPLVPFWLARPLAELGGVVAWACGGNARRRVEANLRRVPSLRGHPRKLRWAARGVFRHTALNYLDFLRGLRISDDEIRERWVIEGMELYHQALAQGKGLVVLAGHYGNWEAGVSRLGLEGYTISAPTERMRPERLFALFQRTRDHHSLRLLPADSRETLRQLMDALKRNEVAAFVIDRYVTGSSMEVPFFDEPARLPTAPVALALRTGAPAMCIFCWRDPGGWRHGRFVPLNLSEAAEEARAASVPNAREEGERAATAPASPSASATRARSSNAMARALAIYVRTMEERINAHPEQWVAALSTVWG